MQSDKNRTGLIHALIILWSDGPKFHLFMKSWGMVLIKPDVLYFNVSEQQLLCTTVWGFHPIKCSYIVYLSHRKQFLKLNANSGGNEGDQGFYGMWY